MGPVEHVVRGALVSIKRGRRERVGEFLKYPTDVENKSYSDAALRK